MYEQKKIYIDEDGNVYVLKKPWYKHWLTITQIITGFFLIVFFCLFIVYSVVINDIENALSMNNLYYDSKNGDIYQRDESSTSLLNNKESDSTIYSNSAKTSSTKTTTNSKVDISDEYAWMNAFASIRDGEILSWSDMMIVKMQYIATLNKFLEMSPNLTEEQKRAVENGKAIMEETVGFYQNAEHYNRELSEVEKSIIRSNITEMMKVVYLFTNE